MRNVYCFITGMSETWTCCIAVLHPHLLVISTSNLPHVPADGSLGYGLYPHHPYR